MDVVEEVAVPVFVVPVEDVDVEEVDEDACARERAVRRRTDSRDEMGAIFWRREKSGQLLESVN